MNNDSSVLLVKQYTGIKDIDRLIDHEVEYRGLDLKKQNVFSSIMFLVGSKCKVDTNKIEDIENRFYSYIALCNEYEQIPTEVQFALFLGIHRSTFWDWINNRSRNGDSRYSDTAKKFKEFFENELSLRTMTANNPAGAIFLLKNNHGYTDKQEISIEPKNPIGDTMSIEEIKASLPDHNNK